MIMPFETLAFDTLIAEYRATGKVPERLNYNTPAEITPEILATLRQIAPNHEPFFLDVTPLPDCRVRRCYGNADLYALRYGGKRIEGWEVFVGWENRYLALNHHAVWQKPDGTYVDLTPNDGEEERILFLPDGQYHLAGSSVPRRFIARKTDQYTLDLVAYHRFCEDFTIKLEAANQDDLCLGSSIDKRPRAGRNDRCPCGSGKKYKHCCRRLYTVCR
jgi:SEC-C motif-containing protein